MTPDLFADAGDTRPARQALAPGALLLPRFAMALEDALLTALQQVLAVAPFRTMTTPGGHAMSVQLSNCGRLGWVSDAGGYRYSRQDPLTGQPWPELPTVFLKLATAAADAAGYPGFLPDAGLLNCYVPGARMSLHQDRDERDFTQPIVSVSLGLPAVFELGGLARRDPRQRIPLAHGDVVVWGGPARLYFHGVLPVQAGEHPSLGALRINLTFRRAS